MNKLNKNSVFHIAYGIDENFMLGAGVSIISIIENNPKITFVFHIFTSNISNNNSQNFKHIEIQFNTIIKVHLIDEKTFDKLIDFPKQSPFTKATFIRFLIPECLKGVTNRVLYIDADIFCTGSIQDLVDIDISNYVTAGVLDIYPTRSSRTQALDMKSEEYFNAGFMLINIPEWLTFQTTEKALAVFEKYQQKLVLFDQDALNVTLEGKVKYIPEKFDYLYDVCVEKDAQAIKNSQAVLVHHVGMVKPWHALGMDDTNWLFLKYYEQSPWSSLPLTYPRLYRQIRILARCLYQRGQFFKSFCAYFKYLKTKVFK